MKYMCPKCKGTDLYIETGGIIGAVYHCKKCDYIGSFIIETEDDMIEKLKESEKAYKNWVWNWNKNLK